MAKELLEKGYYVYLGSRDLIKGQMAVQDLKHRGLSNVEAVQLNVTDESSVKAARATIGSKTEVLDVLINNAGISGVQFDDSGNAIPNTRTATAATIDIFKEVFETNLFGVVMVTQSFLDLLERSKEPRIVMVSSTVGSLSLQSDPN